MSVFEHIKEMVGPNTEEADVWAAQWFPGPPQAAASAVAQLVKTAGGCEYGRLTGQSRFIEDLEMNELQRVQLVLAVEQQFHFEIPDREAEAIKTLGQLIAYVHGRTQTSESAASVPKE
jgi:acyl carrier protein